MEDEMRIWKVKWEYGRWNENMNMKGEMVWNGHVKIDKIWIKYSYKILIQLQSLKGVCHTMNGTLDDEKKIKIKWMKW